MTERVNFLPDGSGIGHCDHNCALCFQTLVEHANGLQPIQLGTLITCYTESTYPRRANSLPSTIQVALRAHDKSTGGVRCRLVVDAR